MFVNKKESRSFVRIMIARLLRSYSQDWPQGIFTWKADLGPASKVNLSEALENEIAKIEKVNIISPEWYKDAFRRYLENDFSLAADIFPHRDPAPERIRTIMEEVAKKTFDDALNGRR